MAFVVNKTNLDELDKQTGEYTHEATGIKATFNSFNDPRFKKAYSMLIRREMADDEAMRNKRLDDSFLDGIDGDEKTADEMLARAIGRFLIADWDVQDQDGNKLEINSDNFILLIASIDDARDFVQWCLDSSTDVTVQAAKSLSETKKKPLRATSGKKTTKA